MKIIERGQLPGKKVYQARCHYCRTLVEFERGEASVLGGVRNDRYLQVQCPVCPHKITTDDR